jgi:hypothetical protein
VDPVKNEKTTSVAKIATDLLDPPLMNSCMVFHLF